jgi:hypothetical protein
VAKRMKKLDIDKLNDVSGGKTEFENIRDSFCYTKKTCDDCGKTLIEGVSDKENISLFNGAYKFHELDYGIKVGEVEVNLCKGCYEKRLLKK